MGDDLRTDGRYRPLLAALGGDARTDTTELARKAGLTRAQADYRLRKLLIAGLVVLDGGMWELPAE